MKGCENIEIWKDVVGYEGYYQVSNTGIVRSVDRLISKSNGINQLRRGKVKSQMLNADGYYAVKLSKRGKDKTLRVHTIVAEAFLNKPSNTHEVNHKDFNRTNNNISNLEWVTHRENVAHTVAAKRHFGAKRDLSGSNNPNYGNRKLHARYLKDPALALEKQSRPGSQNGRSVSIKLTVGGASYIFGCIKDCAQYMIKNAYTNLKISSLSLKIKEYAMAGLSCYGCSFQIID